MKKLLTLILMLTVTANLFSSCKKEQDGTVRFNNHSTNPYSVYLDGTLNTTIQGGYYIDIKTSAGTHSYEVIQQSGFVLYATDEKGTFTLTSGGTADVSFP